MINSPAPQAPQKYATPSRTTPTKPEPMSPGCPPESLEQLCSDLEDVRRSKYLYELENNKSERNLESSYFSKDQHTLDCREKSLLVQIVITAFEVKDFNLAITVARNIFETLHNKTNALKKAMCSLLGRMYLQLGDLQEGEKCFRLADDDIQKTCSENVQCLLDDGILAFSQGHFQKAYDCFHKAYVINPSDLVVRNNCAVSLVYLCRVKDAISILAEAVSGNAETNLQTCLQLNWNTLTELESSRTALPILRENQGSKVSKVENVTFTV